MTTLHNWHVVQFYIAECNHRCAKRNSAQHPAVIDGWNMLAVVSAERIGREIASITETGRAH